MNLSSSNDVQTPLSVVLMSTQRGWGGGEQQASLLLEGLRSRGHQCAVIARQAGSFAQRMEEAGFPVVAVSGRGLTPAALRSMRHTIRRLAPDVVHANDSHAFMSLNLAAVGMRRPLRIATRRTSFPLRNPWQYNLFADRMVCVVESVALQCRQAGIAAERLRVVHSGVDLQRIRSGNRLQTRKLLGINDDQKVLLTIGNLIPCKGHTYLLEALQVVLKQHPEVCLLLAGEGEMRAELQRLVQTMGLEEHVRFLGFRRDAPDLLAAADLFVMPSLLEGICGVVLEVMTVGLPLVTTTAGGIVDVLAVPPGEPQLAWAVPPGETQPLAAAMLEALRSPDEARQRADRARLHAEQRFTSDRMIDNTVRVYREGKR